MDIRPKRIRVQPCCKDIKNIAWVTVNNDFWVTSEAICQWFSRVTKSRMKINGKSHHEWHKTVIHGNKYIILFLTRYLMSLTHIFSKNNHRSLISQLSPRTGFYDLTLWRHHNCSVTSREREILALTSYSSIVLARAYWRKGDRHYWITTVNIDFSSPIFTA